MNLERSEILEVPSLADGEGTIGVALALVYLAPAIRIDCANERAHGGEERQPNPAYLPGRRSGTESAYGPFAHLQVGCIAVSCSLMCPVELQGRPPKSLGV